MTTIIRFSAQSLSKLLAILFGVVGFFLGVLYSVGGLAIDAAVTWGWVSAEAAGTPGLSYGTVLAFGALVGMPLIFTVIGLLVGIVLVWPFNLVLKIFKGIEVDVQEE